MARRFLQTEWTRWLAVACLLWAVPNREARALQADAAGRQYVAASALQDRGDYPHAASAWEKFIADHGSDERIARAQHNLGVCCYQQGKYEQALGVFEKTLTRYPQSDVAVATQLHLGATQVALAQAGHRTMVDRAATTLRALLGKHPQGDHVADAWYYLGECLSAQGKREEAVTWYARLVEKYPGHRFAPESSYALAAAKEDSGERRAAAKGYGQFLAKSPNHRLAADARLSAGRCLVEVGEYDEARAPLTKVIESGGTRAAEATHWLARSLLKQKQPQQALDVLTQLGTRGDGTSWAVQLLLDRADAIHAIPERRKESVPLYAEVAAKHPKDLAAPHALYLAGFVALEVGDYPAALRHAARFQAAYPDHTLTPEVLCVAAESNLQTGKLPEADALYRQLAEKYSNHPDAALWGLRRAAILHAQKKYEEVVRVLEPLSGELQAPDGVAEARYLIGASQLELKQPAAARKSLTASVEAQPKWRQAFETRLALAEACRETGDLAGAQAAARRAIAEFPESRLLDRAYSRLGAYYALAGQPDQAAEAYRKVVRQWPASPLAPYALHELGCAQLNLEDAAGAEATFHSLLEKQVPPALASRARYARAMARQQLGKPAEAAADVEAALGAGLAAGERSDARFLLGLCRTELKQYDKAAEAYGAIVRDDPKYAAAEKAVYHWAWALKRAGRESEASQAFARLAADYPKSPLAAEALCEWGWARQNLGHAAEAVAAYRQALAKSDGESAARAQFLIGKIQADQKDVGEAVKSFIKAAYGYSAPKWQAEATFEAARCLESLGQKSQAAAMYQELLDKFPKSDKTDATKKRLAELQGKK